MLQNKEAVIFDLDGTLVDSMGIWKNLDISYLNTFGISLPGNLQLEIEGMSFTETAQYFKERFQIPDSVDKIKNTWNEMAAHAYTHKVPLKKGVVDFLKICKQQHLKIGIASSNSRELVASVLNAHEIHPYFDTICTACTVGKGKPAPDVYLHAAKELQVEPAKCLVFEDIVAGILAGKAAGMTVCAIEDEYSAYQRNEKKELADYFINDYTEISA